MPHYTKITEVSEQQLEDLVRRYADYIESGLQFLDHQLSTGGGRLDVLMVDSGKSLVVAELKVVEEDGMLLQGLDYYDYVTAHREAYSRLYKLGDEAATQEVRLLLIAPGFSTTLINRCKWLDVDISLYRFECLQFEGADGITPVFIEQTIPSEPAPLKPPTLGEVLGFITDEDVRKRAVAFLDDVKTWAPGVTQDCIKGAVSARVNGRVFAYLSPNRRSFRVTSSDADGNWITAPVKSDEDYRRAVNAVRESFERKKQ